MALTNSARLGRNSPCFVFVLFCVCLLVCVGFVAGCVCVAFIVVLSLFVSFGCVLVVCFVIFVFAGVAVFVLFLF